MATDLILIGFGWLLAAGSAVLWLRENPRSAPSTELPKPSWRCNAMFLAAVVVAAYGGSNIQLHQHPDNSY